MYNRRRDQRLRRDPTVNGTAVAIRKRLKEAYHCLLRSFLQEKRPSDLLIRLPVTSCLCFKPVWGGYMPRVISVSEFIDPDYSWIAKKKAGLRHLSQNGFMVHQNICSSSLSMAEKAMVGSS